jgi:UDP-glucose 4-epimerase
MSRFLITGGAGFIGSHLADALLAAGHRVRVLDDLSTGRRANLDPAAELVVGDVADAATVAAAFNGIDGCFHLAAIASVARANEDWLGAHRVNLGGTIAVLDAARRLGGTPVVYASSAAVYGSAAGVSEQDRASEDRLAAPLSAYGADKLGSELHARAGFAVHGVPSVGFRFFNVYGPRQDPHSPYSGVISLFAAALMARRSITLHGDGLQTRDFVYVADIVAFLLAGMRHAAARPGAHVLNACTGRETSVRRLAEVLGELLQTRPQVVGGPARPGDVRQSVGNPDKAAALLGVVARTSLETGLERTVQGVATLAAAE